MRAFFIGAGATSGTFRTSSTPVPTAAHFGEVLHSIYPRWKNEYPDLGRPDDDWGLEPVWTCMDYYAKLKEAIGRQPPWSKESPQMKKALLQVYGKRCDDAAEQLPLTGNYTLLDLLKNEMKKGDVLISFNYDTITERLAERLADRIGYRVRPVGVGDPKDCVTLAKPHGSVSWTLDRGTCPIGTRFKSDDGCVLLDSLSPDKVDQLQEPLVLGAVPIKSELIREVQLVCQSPGVFDVIAKQQWRAVVAAVRDADVLLVVGYSFPNEDQYGRFLMQEGMRMRKGNRKLSIEFFELKDKVPERTKEIMDTFGPCIGRLVYRGEVEPHS
jgi:hypothetical protein